MEISNVLKDFIDLPRFPDGRISYAAARQAPVCVVFVKRGEKILLLRRSQKVGTYKDMWDVVAGYIDNPGLTLEQHVLLELEEEIGIRKPAIRSITMGRPHEFRDSKTKTWIDYPFVVELNGDPIIYLNTDENVEARWVTLEETKDYETVPGFQESVTAAFG